MAGPPPYVSAISYGAATAVFLILLLLMLRHWRTRRHAPALLAACAATVLWAGVVAARVQSSDGAGEALEPVRTGAWLACLLVLLGCSGWRLAAWLSALVAAAALQIVTALSAAGPLWPEELTQFTLRLVLSVLGMLLVEQLYRNTPQRARWGIKFACIGIGGLFAYDFYLYSDALLFRRINADIWAARGMADALTAPLLAVSAARNPDWAPGLWLSRQMMLRSAAVVGAAIYLLAMAGGGYYMRYVGGAWGPVMQLAGLFGAAALLVGMLFSGSVRARLKVFINKHFYRHSFDYRHEWMNLTRALSDGGPALAERTIQAMAELVESPAGVLWIRSEEGGYAPAAHWNVAPQSSRLADGEALAGFLEARLWVIDVAEWRQHPARYAGLRLPDWLTALPHLWLLVPLVLHGRLFGFVALTQPRTRIALNWEVIDLLKIAGSQAASYLAHQQSANSLMVARQFESFNRMSTFLVHDLKNMMAQLSLLLSNAERHQANPDFQQDMLATLAHSVEKMRLLLRKLGREQTRDPVAPLPLDQLLARAMQAHAAAVPKPELDVTASGMTVLADGSRLDRILGHLIQNAIEASGRDGRVEVRLSREAGMALIEVRDNGHGMSEQFQRERLFRPFESTKAAGMGIGVFESREYVRELGGQLDVSSAPGRGTVFRVRLPLVQASREEAA